MDVYNSSKMLQTEAKLLFFHKLLTSNLIEVLISIMVQVEESKEEHKNYKVHLDDLARTNACEILTSCIQVLPGNFPS